MFDRKMFNIVLRKDLKRVQLIKQYASILVLCVVFSLFNSGLTTGSGAGCRKVQPEDR